MSDKVRLDILIVEKGLVESREKGRALIMAGKVYVTGQKEDKAGTKIDINADVFIKDDRQKYVSRGGYKLEKAIAEFDISLDHKICMDIGASTGGFTDCMLQNGAKKVYSIDVGYGQFDWKLRNDERVVCLEKTNVRYITEEQVPDLADFASIDVSFISLTLVIPPVLSRMTKDGELICLIKPQFEAGRDKVGKKGVVKDISVHKDVILKIVDFAFEISIGVLGIDFSPIKGPEGNIEYLIHLKKNNAGLSKEKAYNLVEKITVSSHEEL